MLTKQISILPPIYYYYIDQLLVIGHSSNVHTVHVYTWLKNSKLDDDKDFYNLLMTMKRFAKLLDGLEELAYNKQVSL